MIIRVTVQELPLDQSVSKILEMRESPNLSIIFYVYKKLKQLWGNLMVLDGRRQQTSNICFSSNRKVYRWQQVKERLSNWFIQTWMSLYLLQGVQQLLQASNFLPSRNLVVLVESHNLHLLQPLPQHLDVVRYPERTNARSNYCSMHADRPTGMLLYPAVSSGTESLMLFDSGARDFIEGT